MGVNENSFVRNLGGLIAWRGLFFRGFYKQPGGIERAFAGLGIRVGNVGQLPCGIFCFARFRGAPDRILKNLHGFFAGNYWAGLLFLIVENILYIAVFKAVGGNDKLGKAVASVLPDACKIRILIRQVDIVYARVI